MPVPSSDDPRPAPDDAAPDGRTPEGSGAERPQGPEGRGDLRLVPGARVVVRRPGLLGVIGPWSAGPRVTLPDGAAVRRLLTQLAEGSPPPPDATGRRVLQRLVTAGLTESADAEARRAEARRRARVVVDADDHGAAGAPALELLLSAGLGVTARPEVATHALVTGRGEVDRDRVADWTRRGVPHLVVVDHDGAVTLGPYVVPGLTPCLHCVDAHRAEADPDHPEVVAALARTPPLALRGDGLHRGREAALRMAALGWAVADLVTAVEGGRPLTAGATVSLERRPGSPPVWDHRTWARHPDCGCAWAEAVGSR